MIAGVSCFFATDLLMHLDLITMWGQHKTSGRVTRVWKLQFMWFWSRYMYKLWRISRLHTACVCVCLHTSWPSTQMSRRLTRSNVGESSGASEGILCATKWFGLHRRRDCTGEHVCFFCCPLHCTRSCCIAILLSFRSVRFPLKLYCPFHARRYYVGRRLELFYGRVL